MLLVVDMKIRAMKAGSVSNLQRRKHQSVPGHGGLREDREWTEVFVLVQCVVDRSLWRDPGQTGSHVCFCFSVSLEK